MAYPTKDLTPAVVDTAPVSSQPHRGRLVRTKRLAAAVSASALISLSVAGGPLAVAGIGAAPASAATSVLNQTQGGSSPSKGLGQTGTKDNGASNLNVAPNWNAPGIAQGKQLIGWAKAGAVVLGVLGMIGGVVGGSVLKNMGSHHATGVRATALSIGGAMVVAGTATTLIPGLMG